MKFFYSFVYIVLLLGASQASPNVWDWIKGAASDTENWVKVAMKDVHDFLQPDHLKEHLTKFLNSEEFKLAKGFVQPKCHWKATASCAPEAVDKAKKKAEEDVASGQKLSKSEVLKWATGVATECWVSNIHSIFDDVIAGDCNSRTRGVKTGMERLVIREAKTEYQGLCV
ncbi:hypothetical protein QAD02_009406 [Eretmocerus hayati]|uniref:Uncharacterized protein n=1 Tax=Eretmocerus hayati TaxID=131215 RepID=A0ACC2NAG9_9HYME|nr:hypothetical protein QAD02_009406 [Eretmocerus hayati]